MKELTDEQKTSIWTRLGSALGLSEKVQVKLADYVAKDGSTISVSDESGQVQGDIQDGEIELEDGRILTIAEGIATVKDAPEPDETKAADAAPEDATTATDELDAAKAENEQLKVKIAELEQALAEAKTSTESLSTKLAAIESKPADKKNVMLSNQPKATDQGTYGAQLRAAFGIK